MPVELDEAAEWPEQVRGMSTTDRVLGGDRNAPLNLGVGDCANRTAWLRQQLEALGVRVETLATSARFAVSGTAAYGSLDFALAETLPGAGIGLDGAKVTLTPGRYLVSLFGQYSLETGSVAGDLLYVGDTPVHRFPHGNSAGNVSATLLVEVVGGEDGELGVHFYTDFEGELTLSGAALSIVRVGTATEPEPEPEE